MNYFPVSTASFSAVILRGCVGGSHGVWRRQKKKGCGPVAKNQKLLRRHMKKKIPPTENINTKRINGRFIAAFTALNAPQS